MAIYVSLKTCVQFVYKCINIETKYHTCKWLSIKPTLDNAACNLVRTVRQGPHRRPYFLHHVFYCRYVKDGVPAILVSLLLFIFPSRLPEIFCNRKHGRHLQTQRVLESCTIRFMTTVNSTWSFNISITCIDIIHYLQELGPLCFH